MYVNVAEGEEPEEYTFPENPAAADYLMHPVRMCSNFSNRLQHNFGWRFAVQVPLLYTGTLCWLYLLFLLTEWLYWNCILLWRLFGCRPCRCCAAVKASNPCDKYGCVEIVG